MNPHSFYEKVEKFFAVDHKENKWICDFFNEENLITHISNVKLLK